MPILRCQVEIPRDTAIGADRSVNVFHFEQAASWDAAGAAAVAIRLEEFYTDAGGASPGAGYPAQTTALQAYLGSVNASPARIKCYRLEDPIERVPIYDETFVLTPGTSALPEEVACCLSYRGELVSGVDRARQRGRIYIGPLSDAALDVRNGRTRPSFEFINNLLAASTFLRAVGAGVEHVVVSTVGGVPVTTPITAYSVDDAFDTQRRRGPAVTARYEPEY